MRRFAWLYAPLIATALIALMLGGVYVGRAIAYPTPTYPAAAEWCLTLAAIPGPTAPATPEVSAP